MQLLQLQGWGDCRDGVAAGMQNGCRDAEELQGCNCYSCEGGVIAEVGWLQGCRTVAEMGVVAGMQGGCRLAEWSQ